MNAAPPARLGSWVVDASVWAARFIPSDVHNSASRRWIERRLRAGDQLVGPNLLLVEVAGSVARRTGDLRGSQAIVNRLARRRGLLWVPLDSHLRDRAAQLAIALGLRGADAVYVAVADQLSIPLVSWASSSSRAPPRPSR